MATLFLMAWSVIGIAVGAWFGLKFPDFDQRTDLPLHRSIIMHGPLVPLVAYLLLRNARSLTVRVFPMFLCLGFLVHLAFDLFPRAWSGYALISVPVYGWLPAIVSVVWIASSAMLCAYLASRLVRGLHETVLLILGTLGIFAYAFQHEASLIEPLIAAVGALAVGWVVSLF